ncbi:MAG: hypothetical protein R2681_07035 [Pyrinomonadaceae bacterium]
MKNLPKARSTNIVVQELEHETLVYDLLTHKASCLNKTMSIIWNCCDGKTDVERLTEILSEKAKIAVSKDFIFIALSELSDSKLLTEEFGRFDTKNVSRRNILLDYALPAMAIPVVLSISVPTAAQAGSCFVSTCTSDADCTNAAFPKCTNGCCDVADNSCQSDADCTNPGRPNCINNVCSA